MHFDSFHCLCDNFKCIQTGENADFANSVDTMALKNSINPFDNGISFPHYSFYNPNSIYLKGSNYYVKSHQMKEFTDVRQMESTLYQLLTDFHLGKLHAFGDGVTFENMIKVREQQENLARLHFELNLQQSNKQSFENDFFNDTVGGNSIMSKPFSKSNMLKLIQNLQNLCKSIERLQQKNSNDSNENFF